jgi:hypothetical protein
MIRDKILVYEDLESLYLKCYSCNEKHSFHKCPAIQLVSDKKRTIFIHQKSIKNRKSIRRSLPKPRQLKKFHSLIDSNIIQVKSEKFHACLDMNNNDISLDEDKPIAKFKGSTNKHPVAIANKILSIEDGKNNGYSSFSPFEKSKSLRSMPIFNQRRKSTLEQIFSAGDKKRPMGKGSSVSIIHIDWCL